MFGSLSTLSLSLSPASGGRSRKPFSSLPPSRQYHSLEKALLLLFLLLLLLLLLLLQGERLVPCYSFCVQAAAAGAHMIGAIFGGRVPLEQDRPPPAAAATTATAATAAALAKAKL